MNDKLENLIIRLRIMRKILGLSQTEKETLDEAADIIELFMNFIREND